MKDYAAESKKVRKRAALGLYLTTNHVFSYRGITDFVYVGPRGCGKSVISVETIIQLKEKYGYENVKAYYFRITDQSVKAMVTNHAEKAVDPYLIHKYNLDITSKGYKVYNHGKELLEFMPLVSAGSKGKGVNLYDCTWWADPKKKRFIVTIWDEFILAEGVEKRSVGDPVAQYKIYREAIFRDAPLQSYNAVYNFLLANDCGSIAAVTGALYNYIPNPNCYTRVKLTRKRAMVWNIPVTEKYREKRKMAVNSNITDFVNDANYNNIAKDISLIKPKRIKLQKPTTIIKFGKTQDLWFTLYDGKYIRLYRGEKFKAGNTISMKRYVDDFFNPDLVQMVFDRFDMRNFMFADLMSLELFQAQLKLIKVK